MTDTKQLIKNRINILKMILEKDTFPDKTDEFIDLQVEYEVSTCEDPWYDGDMIRSGIYELDRILKEIEKRINYLTEWVENGLNRSTKPKTKS
jgi:hypothetical protein